MSKPTSEAYYAAMDADDAYNRAIQEAFGAHCDRWSTSHRTQMTHPSVKAAYEAKIAADQLCHDLAEAERIGSQKAKTWFQRKPSYNELWKI